ncbi:MAG: M23 family metallopeptidase [Chloroflexota bacterium]|nr:M23 family metallopeptidase [Chloroflexota bacterium]
MREHRPKLGRLTDARLVTRAIAHLAVIGLVAFTSAIGIAAAHGQSNGSGELGFKLVSQVRGASAAISPLTAYAYEFAPQVGRTQPDPDPLRMPQPQLAPTPKPTPVPLKKAAPLPAPTPAPQIGFVQQTAQQVGPAAPVGPPPPDSGGTLTWPVAGGVISQYFSAGHLAIDIAAPAGNTVVAAAAGVVTSAGWRTNGGGLVVEVAHPNGISTVYNHLGSIWVGAGQKVARGQGIAAVGCTGICTGPHVHFEVVVGGGVLVNPLRYL